MEKQTRYAGGHPIVIGHVDGLFDPKVDALARFKRTVSQLNGSVGELPVPTDLVFYITQCIGEHYTPKAMAAAEKNYRSTLRSLGTGINHQSDGTGEMAIKFGGRTVSTTHSHCYTEDGLVEYFAPPIASEVIRKIFSELLSINP